MERNQKQFETAWVTALVVVLQVNYVPSVAMRHAPLAVVGRMLVPHGVNQGNELWHNPAHGKSNDANR